MAKEVPVKPEIEVEVTFLFSAEGGHSAPAYNSPCYRPHLVVGASGQRLPITAADGRTLAEDYLGVSFTGNGEEFVLGRCYEVTLQLLYFPQVSYEKLIPGPSFNIREGGHIVGFGVVKRAMKHVTT